MTRLNEIILEKALISAMGEISKKSILERDKKIADMYDDGEMGTLDFYAKVEELQKRMIIGMNQKFNL